MTGLKNHKSCPTAVYQLTLANAAALDAANLSSNDAISDTIDSDALLVSDIATIIYTTGGPGQNNHGLDVGFAQSVNGQVDIVNRAPTALPTGTLIIRKNAQVITNCAEVIAAVQADPNATPGDGVGDDAACAAFSLVTAGGQQFSFSDTIATTAGVVTPTFDLAMGESITFSNVISGVYTITETATSGWRLQDVTCSDGSAPGAVQVSTGEVVICTFTNVEVLSLGNRVWNDLNNDGLMDAGEVGLADVLLTLLDSSGLTVTNGSGTAITTTTDANGYYTFTDLISDTYRVRVDGSNFLPGGVLAGFLSSGPSDATPNNNEDLDDNGIDPTAYAAYRSAGVLSGPISLSYGAEPAGEDHLGTVDASNSTNFTVDFGFYLPHVLIGDRLWVEDDNDGDATTGSITSVGAGHVVTATASDGVTVYTDTTDANGLYTITVPANDTYTVTTDLPAGGVVDTPIHATDGGDLGNNDLNHDRAGTTVAVTTTNNLSIDFGFFQPQPTIEVVKFTNGVDADLATGPIIAVGETVTWTYEISNTGNVTLTNVTLGDDSEGSVSCPAVELAPHTGMTCVLTGTATAGQYANTAIVTGTPTLGSVTTVTDSNPSHYYGGNPGIVLRKYTNGYDADDVTGPYLAAGDVVTWTYVITNTDNQTLTNLALMDSVEGVITCPVNELAVGDSTTCEWTGTAVSGQYTNTAVVSGTTPGGSVLTFTNPSHYYGVQPSIVVIKYTNGEDADTIPGPTVNAGDMVTWTYIVTNTGNVALTNIDLTDNVEGAVACPSVDLAVGGSMECTWTGRAISGQYTNTAIVTGTPNIPTNPTPELPGVPTTPTPNTPVTDTNPSHYFGHTVNIGDYVWVDGNGNGVQDEPATNGLEGVTVTLTTPSGAVITTTTDANGIYTFTNLLPNTTYTVTFSTPDGYSFTTPNQGGDDTADSDAPASGVVVVNLGTTDDMSIDAGIYLPPASLGDTVWEDLDHDGVQDVNEPGIPGVTVTLTDSNGMTQTVTTDASGHYTFTNLLPGDYTVIFTPPVGYESTPVDQSDDTTDSDGATVIVTLQPGEHNPTIDSGFWQPLSLGNQVWEDLNNNGVKDGSEAGIAGVTVNLYRDSDNNGQPDGVALATMTTDANGLYLFTGLTSDHYIIEIVAPAGYVSSTPDAGDADLDSDDSDDNGIGNGAGLIRSHAVTLSAGAEPLHENPDNDLVTPDANENLTVDFGIWRPVNLGNFVWLDGDRDGQQDVGEAGVANVVVTLQLPTGVVMTTTTDATGYYTFTNLLPNQVYVVTFTLPAGFSFTTPNQGDDVLDSDTNNGGAVTVNLETADDYTIDAGLVVNPVQVGDVAFSDMNLNGRQDAGDQPLPALCCI